MPNAMCAAKNQDCGKEKEMNKKITILYERLSLEDDRDGESNSITNQRTLLEEYAERNGFTPYIHISDDGYSGTNWNRPGWQELIAKIETGEVENLLVKDSSRLGRDHLRVGLFRELLREKDIRLIAVNDGFDSSKGEDDFTPFRDIMAEWYARDCSRKARSTLQLKGKKGIPLSSRPPYGYYKNPEVKNHWLVDEVAAKVVRRIYALTIEGKTAFQIANILHDEKVERPSYHQTKNGYVTYAGALEAENPYAWQASNIKTILSREEYLGHIVNFRTKKPSFKSKKEIKRAKEDWLIFENVHEPIVDKETWELVQGLNKTKRRIITSLGEASPLTGLVFCETCGSKMYHHRSQKGNHDYYECANFSNAHRKFGKDYCTPHSVSSKSIKALLLEVIKKTAIFTEKHEEKFVEIVRKNSHLMQKETLKKHTTQITKNERRIAELDKTITNLYEDKVQGVITAERFNQMSATFEAEQSTLKDETKIFKAEIKAFNEENQKPDKFISIVKKFTEFEELTTPMINEFVEKVIIHEAVWTEASETSRRMGSRSQQIDIHLKYIGEFLLPDNRTPEEIEAERIEWEKLEKRRKKQREYMRRKKAEKKAAEQAAAVA